MAARTSLRECEQGSAAIEFAVVAPVMLVLLGGMLELGYVAFARSTLESAILEAARASRVTDCPDENGTHIEAALAESMTVVKSADGQPPKLTVSAYGKEFGNVGSPEPFSDTDANGQHDAGEPYNDTNGNGQWDADMGTTGAYGSFGDVVRFDATYQVPSLFSYVSNTINDGKDAYTVSATTVVRNEPYQDVSCP